MELTKITEGVLDSEFVVFPNFELICSRPVSTVYHIIVHEIFLMAVIFQHM